MVTRRAFLAAVAGATVAGRARPALAAGAPRIAAIDWAMGETAMALGHMPVAMAELIAYRRRAPLTVPGSTADLGLRGAPNLEALALIAPDLTLSSSYYSFVEPQLQRIAPVTSRALYVPGEPPLPKVTALVSDLAALLGVDASPVLRAADAAFAAMAAALAPLADTPCILIELGDSRHIRVFGDDSLYGGALLAMGLRNGWQEGTRFAFGAPVPITRLADFPQARIVIASDVPAQAERALRKGAFWNSLPAVRAGRVHRLPEGNAFGGLPSALRFARDLAAALGRTAGLGNG